MRVTIVNQFYPPDISPTARLAASLAEHRARDCGDDVSVVASFGGYVNVASPASSPAVDPTASPASPTVLRTWTPRFGKSTTLRRLADYACFYVGAAWRLATLPEQDVIVSLTTPPFIAWAGVLHKLLHPRAKLILWNMDVYPDVLERFGGIRKGGVVSRVLRWMNRTMLRRVDHLVCLDAAMESLIRSQYADASGRPEATVIENWEDHTACPPRSGDTSPNEPFDVLYMGNLGAGHAFETALGAAELTADAGIRFVFRGGGKRWDALAESVRAAGLSNVTVGGYVGEKEQSRETLGEAACALITLRDDALGVMSPSKLYAALAAGRPILYIGPTGSNVDDVIRRFACGVSVRHGKDGAAQAARYLEALRNDRSLWRDAGTRARTAFERHFDDRAAFARFDLLIDKLGAQPARAGRLHNRTRPSR